jgi:hypothetical protein
VEASLEVQVGRAFCSFAMAVLLVAAAPTAALSVETPVAETILEKAIASYREGNLQPALGGINASLRGGLSSSQTARALYYRGLIYRKQGSPGHAISDLTRALDYDALSVEERSEAMEARAAAYQEAGVADQEMVVIAPVTGNPNKATPPAPPTTAAIVSPQVVKPPAANWGGATQVAANAPLPVPTAHPPAVAAWSGTTQIAPPPKPAKEPAKKAAKSAPAPAPAPAKPWVTDSKKADTEKEKTSPAVAKAATPVKKPAAVAKQARASQPAKPSDIEITPIAPLPWAVTNAANTATARSSSSAPVDPFVTQVAAVTPLPLPPPEPVAAVPVAIAPAPASPAAPVPPPEIRLLVGAAHSRSEAFALAIRLTSQRGPLGPRRPQIIETTPPGSSPPLYRLRLGPFADATQAQSLCRSLNDSGYACAIDLQVASLFLAE